MWRTRSVSHPEGLPRLFLDRSLGSYQVPRLLREAGLHLLTMAEHYGTPEDQAITDPEWLELVGSNGWVAFTKDEGIRFQAVNRKALIEHNVRCFYIGRQDIPAREMAQRFLRNLPAIVRASGRPGPFMIAVYRNEIRKMPIRGLTGSNG